MEKYPHGNSSNTAEEIRKTKEELQRLEAEDAEWDKFRSLPLYSSKCTGYRFFCSLCWDQAYQVAQEEQRKNRKV